MTKKKTKRHLANRMDQEGLEVTMSLLSAPTCWPVTLAGLLPEDGGAPQGMTKSKLMDAVGRQMAMTSSARAGAGPMSASSGCPLTDIGESKVLSAADLRALMCYGSVPHPTRGAQP